MALLLQGLGKVLGWVCERVHRVCNLSSNNKRNVVRHICTAPYRWHPSLLEGLEEFETAVGFPICCSGAYGKSL